MLQAAFEKVMVSESQEAGLFIDSFRERSAEMPAAIQGRYIAALHVRSPGQRQYPDVIDPLRKSDREVVVSFLEAMAGYDGPIRRPQDALRVLLAIPYIDRQTEARVGDMIDELISRVRKTRSQLLTKFHSDVAKDIDEAFASVKQHYLTLHVPKPNSQQADQKQLQFRLMVRYLARHLERYADPDLFRDVTNYFRGNRGWTARDLLKRLETAMASAPAKERRLVPAYMALFNWKVKRDRLYISSQLSWVDLKRPDLIRRLNRLVRVAGKLRVRAAAGRIRSDIRPFAHTEGITFLEETSVVTLCQLADRSKITMHELEAAAEDPERHRVTLNGYLRGARYLPPRAALRQLVLVLARQKLSSYSEGLIIDTLDHWNLSSHWTRIPGLLAVLERGDLEPNNRLRLGLILARNADVSVLQTYIDLSQGKDPVLGTIAARALRSIARSRPGSFRDVLSDRLYVLLESGQMDVQIQALMALVEMEDDYALEVLKENITSREADYVVALLDEISGTIINHDILTHIASFLLSPDPKVATTAGRVLEGLSKGEYAEEVRNLLVGMARGEKTHISPPELEEIEHPLAPLIGHAKAEYRFRRENAQILTVFFIDIVSFTARSTITDTSTLMGLIDAFMAIVVPTVESNGGSVVKKMGDGALAVFKHPLKAALAALSVRRQVERYNEPRVAAEKFNVRIGLNTGEVIRREEDVFGEVVNIASRMETSANPGEILLTQSTYDEIKEHIVCTPLGAIQVKGKKDPIMAYAATEVMAGLDGVYGSLGDSPEGTERQLEELRLTETVVSPTFVFPSTTEIDGDLAGALQKVFVDITKAGEELTRDYREENAFKRYIQEKWDELIHSVLTRD
jgi:class 3 adenylate cyclase